MTGRMLLVSLLFAGCARMGQAELELVPAVVAECKLPTATVVRWDVSRLGLRKARLEINNLGEPRKFWINGEAAGSAEAGAWARDGYTVTLLSMNGVVLARRTLTTFDCPD